MSWPLKALPLGCWERGAKYILLLVARLVFFKDGRGRQLNNIG